MANRQPASVYRRRRLVVLLAAIALVVLVWWAIAALTSAGSNGAAPATSATPTTQPPTSAPAAAPSTPAGQPAESPSPVTEAPLVGCTSNDVKVEAVTDAGVYAPEAQPLFALRLTNTSGSACAIDVGPAAQTYVVTSGGATVWASADCAQPAASEVVRLEPGQAIASAGFAWVREHSAPDTCDGVRPPAEAGGTTYQLAVTIGGIASAPLEFTLS